MNSIKYSQVSNMRISVIGSSAVGKTSICTRITNNFFTSIYEPTMELTYYSTLFKVTESEVTNKTYIFTSLEDFFGLNNPLINQNEKTINSDYLKGQRTVMTNSFREMMFTSVEKRDQLSKESETKKAKKYNPKTQKDPKFEHWESIFEMDKKKIERKAFILVCDITDLKSLEQIKGILDKLQQIEKTNNLPYPKCIFINKMDRNLDKKKCKVFMTELEAIKHKYKLEFYKVSALTNSGVIDSFRKFMSKIHQDLMDKKQNEGMDEDLSDEEEEDIVTFADKLNSCGRKVLCGKRVNLFSCGNPPDEDEDETEEG